MQLNIIFIKIKKYCYFLNFYVKYGNENNSKVGLKINVFHGTHSIFFFTRNW